jgi:type VI secretion system protein ImpJ
MTSKVLWGEGLLLRPQHFQRQDAYHEHCLYKSVKAVHPYAWGVEGCDVDHEALASGMLRVQGLTLRSRTASCMRRRAATSCPPRST